MRAIWRLEDKYDKTCSTILGSTCERLIGVLLAFQCLSESIPGRKIGNTESCPPHPRTPISMLNGRAHTYKSRKHTPAKLYNIEMGVTGVAFTIHMTGYRNRGLQGLHARFIWRWYGNRFTCSAGETLDIEIGGYKVCNHGLYDDVTVIHLHVHKMRLWKSIPDYCSYVWILIQGHLWRHNEVRESKILTSYSIRHACSFPYVTLLFWM